MSPTSQPVPLAPRPAANYIRLAGGLLLTPIAFLLAARVAPHLSLGETAANVSAFAGAALLPILGLSLAATVEVRLGFALLVAAGAGALLLALSVSPRPPLITALLVDTALFCLSWAIGCSLGRRVQHPAHLLPACVVAASADLVSLLSPEGPSHAIAGSERALTVLALWFPVPGGNALAPALGVGDLLFMALAFGVAHKHGLPYARCVLAGLGGTALAGAAATWSGVAIPALVPIAAMLLLTLPAIRRLRRADRAAAHWSMLIAASVALATIARAWLAAR